MVDITRRKAIGGVGGIILLGTCVAATDPDEEDTEASADDTTDDTNGSDETDDADDTDNGEDDAGNGEDDDEDEETEPEVDEPDVQSFSGSGATVEDGVEIEGGLTVVDASHTGGDSNFTVHLVDDSEFDEMFVNEIGEYDGETADLIDAGTYQLDVEADGNWEIEVRQPRASSGDGLPQSVSGNSSEVFGPFEFDGSHTADGSHSGDSNFAVHVYPSEGEFGELVFNEIGEYSGETTFNHDEIGYVAVEANGDFSVDME